MADFLTTTAVNFRLEELIKNASDRVILISPYLKINNRIRDLLEDKDRLKIDVRIIYGKSELHPEEVDWLRNLDYVRTSYCENLHAKCYLSEDCAIITSMNLYEFSQINNNEMGILVRRDEDASLYHEVYEEAQRLIRVSDEVKLTVEKVVKKEESDTPLEEVEDSGHKLTTSKLAKKVGLNTSAMEKQLCEMGFISEKDGKYQLTDKGVSLGAESKYSPYKKDYYFLWPESVSDMCSSSK
ncbi:MAG: phospholipase D family protein [Planctomycetes bacterium]|nr:phospholipase D family protein [Planctomycetota bacterium]